MEGTTTLCRSLNLRQELSKVIQNTSIEIVYCHVRISQINQLLPQSEDDKYIRKHREYRAVRETLKTLVTHLMFRNKTILFEYIDDWLQKNVVNPTTPDNSATSTSSSTFKQSTTYQLQPAQVMPKLRTFFKDLITKN